MMQMMKKFKTPRWLQDALYYISIAAIVIGGIALVLAIIVGMLALAILLRFGIPALVIWFALDYGVGDWLATMIPQVPASAFHPTFWQALIGVVIWRVTLKVLFGFKKPDPTAQRIARLLKQAEKSIEAKLKAAKPA